MKLDFSALEKAVASLERGIVRASSAPADEELRDAVIQRFEYTYELCWKMLKRQIEAEAASPAAVDGYSFRDLLREGAERGMVENIEDWFGYRESRNITSHTYDEAKAAEVYQAALRFLSDAKRLLAELARRNG